MKRYDVMRILKVNQEALKAYSVRSLAIFGSVARDEATDASDVDILVEFEAGSIVGLFEFVRLRRFLAGLLGCEVDLVTPEALREEMRQQVLREAIRAA